MGIGRIILRSPRLTMFLGVLGALVGVAMLLTFYVIFPDPDAAADDATIAVIAAGAIATGAGVFWIGYRRRQPR